MQVSELSKKFYFVGATSPEAEEIRKILKTPVEKNFSFFVEPRKGSCLPQNKYKYIYGMRGYLPDNDREVFPLFPTCFFLVKIFTLSHKFKIERGDEWGAIDAAMEKLSAEKFDLNTPIRVEAEEVTKAEFEADDSE